jgi:uncharacterized repeat protein (TIGR03803 family)
MEAARAQTGTETVLLSFGDFPHGANPYAPLVRDAAGNLYGTTNQGGAANVGVVFKLTPSREMKVLHSFQGGTDGANPYSGVALDSAGNLYGTTYGGGAANAGVVYKVDATGHETVLYSFTGGADGANPYAGVVPDSAGNLYGTTYNGGGSKAGVVYKVSPSGQETVLYTFTGGTDGGNPYAGVIFDSSGNLYGTAMHGGSAGYYAGGVIYKLDMARHETVLYNFDSQHAVTAASSPYAGVILDAVGNLYGTASEGGLLGTGIIYKLDTSGKFTALHDFTSYGPRKPQGGLILDSAGNLYGTTQQNNTGAAGTVFKLDTAGNLKVLYSFPGASNPQGFQSGPNGGLVRDSAGNLYGATAYGGVSGMVYKLAPSGKETTLYSFQGASGGTYPGTIIRDSAGDIFGVTGSGGAANFGTVYKLDAAGHEAVLYAFTGGSDGAYPGYGPVRDSAGNLYGTASRGGSASGRAGFGVVYKLDMTGKQTVLHTFTGGVDGGYPNGVILDPAGNLYGTAWYGAFGAGVVYKIDTAGQQTVLYSFTGGADGATPNSLILDSAGNLYGTADGGGAGFGVIFELDTSSQETVLHSFQGNSYGVGPDGAGPYGVTRDSAGNLYGVTAAGGSQVYAGAGVVFELDATGRYTVLYRFTGGADGGGPGTAPLRDSAGNLYGVAGGGMSACWAEGGLGGGCGVVYEVDPSGVETVLHTFTGRADGAGPSGLVADSAGNLYGATAWGGRGGFNSVSFSGGGVVYKIKP